MFSTAPFHEYLSKKITSLQKTEQQISWTDNGNADKDKVLLRAGQVVLANLDNTKS
jgi:hypothetical protein